MINRSIAVAPAVCLFLVAALHAQETPTLPPPGATNKLAKPFNAAEATEAWLATVPADQRTKSDAYFEGGYWLILWNFLTTAAISILLLESRLSARLRDFARRLTRLQAIEVVLYAVPCFVVFALLSFPLTLYQGFYREHQYGMATQSFSGWIRDQLKLLFIILILGPPMLALLYAVFRRARRTWPIGGTIVAVGLAIFANFIAPVFIEPLFNTYKALEDPKIRAPILTMARANEVPVDKVFVVDASRQTNRIGANVAGLFGTTRIALNDNLIKRCTLPEIREVMAHEIGHYVLNHGAKLTIYFGIFALVGFALTRILFERALEKWGKRWVIREVADPAGLPLLILIFSTYVFVISPLLNTVTRITEREADAFGINTCREPDGAAMVALKLGEYRKLNPGPIEEFMFFDHPSGRARIRMAMDWKAAHSPAGE
jgi:STE24 endopeptidase